MQDISILLVFSAGFLSFISPCCLPLYPAFLSYITGVSLQDLQGDRGIISKKSLLHTLFFLLGFSIVFIAIGFGTSFMGQLFITNQDLIRQLGAIAIFAFGMVTAGVWAPIFLMREYKFRFGKRPSGLLGSSLIGVVYAAGWMPCTGPILVSVIGLAAINPQSAIPYMIAYIFGFAIPFFVMSFFITKLKWLKNNAHLLVKIGGYVMMAMGVLLFFDWMTKITSVFISMTGGFRGW